MSKKHKEGREHPAYVYMFFILHRSNSERQTLNPFSSTQEQKLRCSSKPLFEIIWVWYLNRGKEIGPWTLVLYKIILTAESKIWIFFLGKKKESSQLWETFRCGLKRRKWWGTNLGLHWKRRASRIEGAKVKWSLCSFMFFIDLADKYIVENEEGSHVFNYASIYLGKSKINDGNAVKNSRKGLGLFCIVKYLHYQWHHMALFVCSFIYAHAHIYVEIRCSN